MRVLVTIMPKDGVLDPQGEAIRLALSGLGFGGVKGVRQGKVIEIDLAAADRAAAREEVARMCRTLLANEIIESWRVDFGVKAAILVFPGSNCDRDLAVAFRAAGAEVEMAWHKDTALPDGTDIVGLPGGFAWGDYLRCGAIAARAPIMAALREHVERGGYALGVCNGFQVLTEAGILPGALIRNAGLRFVCRTVAIEVATADSAFTARYAGGGGLRLPVAHHDGNYVADVATLDALEGEDRVAFRYGEEVNGSARRIAGILSANRRVLGLMPHPERAADPGLGLTDGAALFRALGDVMAAA